MQKGSSNPTLTVLTLSVGFMLIFLWTDQEWTIWIAVVVGGIGALSAKLRMYIDQIWMKLGEILSRVVPPILLTLIFYLILFPIAILSRVFGRKDPFLLKNTRDSLFQDREEQFEKDSFEKMW